VRSRPGTARTILLSHIISARPSKQPLMVRTFLKVYMELGFYFLFLQEQIKDIIIMQSKRSCCWLQMAFSGCFWQATQCVQLARGEPQLKPGAHLKSGRQNSHSFVSMISTELVSQTRWQSRAFGSQLWCDCVAPATRSPHIACPRRLCSWP